jgi:hypothetical protein
MLLPIKIIDRLGLGAGVVTAAVAILNLLLVPFGDFPFSIWIFLGGAFFGTALAALSVQPFPWLEKWLSGASSPYSPVGGDQDET